MSRLAILSDTHIPTRADSLPDWVRTEIEAADHAIHAGDFTAAAVLEEVDALVDGAVTAVSGNMDSGGLGLPETQRLEMAGQTFVVTHGTGPTAGYEDRVRAIGREHAAGPEPIVVAGHTHSVLDDRDGIRILNPGSATGAAPASETSMMRAEVTQDGVSVEVLRG